jgi:uncharacterized membrane protein
MEPGAPAASRGRIWLLHSGGFYDVEKTLDPGSPVPRPLHWFKWQAYTTWLSGAVLLVTIYYATGGALLVAPESGLHVHAAITIGVLVIVGGEALYELLLRTPLLRRPLAMAVLGLGALLALEHALSHVFTGRATFLHVGALLGTLMAANVAHAIMPAQRQQVAAAERGEPPDPRLSERAKLRSLHNNYLTFPVVVLMLSTHFPGYYSHRWSWLVLGVLLVGGALVRHIMNIRFHYRHWIPALGATVAASMLALFVLGSLAEPRGARAARVDDGAPVDFATAAAIVHKRCTVCHSATPADRTFGPAPGGVSFDTDAAIRALAPRIEARAVTTQTMPPANSTWMTDQERALLGWWARAQR